MSLDPVAKAAEHVCSFLQKKSSDLFNEDREYFFWIQSDPKSNSAVSNYFPTPNWDKIKREVEKFVYSSKELLQVSKSLLTSMNRLPGERELFVDRWIIFLYVAYQYGAITIEQVNSTVQASLNRVLGDEGRDVCEILVPIFGFWKLKEEFRLNEHVSLLPANLGMVKYLTILRTEYNHASRWYPNFIPMVEHIPLIRIRIPVKYPKTAHVIDSSEARLILARVKAAFILAFPRKVQFPYKATSPLSFYNGGNHLSALPEVPMTDNLQILQDQLEPIAKTWELVKNLDLAWFEAPKETIAFAFKRYATSMGEPPAEATLAIIIALETLLNVQSEDKELSFRYSLMAATALGKNSKHRREIFDLVRKGYDLRSKTVHTGRAEISEPQLVLRLTKCVSILIQMALHETNSKRGLKDWVSKIRDYSISGETFPNPFRILESK